MGSPTVVVASGEKYNIGEKTAIILSPYIICRHAKTEAKLHVKQSSVMIYQYCLLIGLY